jgi:ATP-binding cassette, subfamily C, bacterial LapB
MQNAPHTPQGAPPGEAFAQWLKTLVTPLAPLFKEVLVVSLFVNVLAIAVPVFVLQVYDRVIFHAGLSTLQGLVIGILAVVVFDFLLRRVRARILQTVALRIDVAVSQRLMDKLLALPLRTLEDRPAAFWQVLFRDADVIRNTLSGSTAVLAMDLLFAVLFLGIVALIALPVFWVLVVVFAAFVALAWHAGRFVNDATEKERLKTINRDALVSELIAGRTTIKALALGGRMREMWEERQEASIVGSMERGMESERYVYLGQSMTLIATIAMTTVGALAILDQKLTIGGLIAANMLSGRLLGPLNQLVGAWRTFAAFRQSAERLGRIFGEEEEVAQSPIQMPRPTGRMTLDNVTFRYANDAPPAVEGIKLEIPAGGMTAIMGPNGCGKTTLAKMMLGLYRPSEGHVFLDGADIAQFARGDLARWIGYVPQECTLFAGTIRENIASASPDASDEDVIRAATLAQAHSLIVNLPKGYGTPVGEAGMRLPGGLRQRIAIARALVADPPVLVMDEPTSNVDRAAEEELRNSLLTLSKDHTIILVSHSPMIVQACHNVVVMEKGRIRAVGPTNKILQAPAPVMRVVPGDAADAKPVQGAAP